MTLSTSSTSQLLKVFGLMKKQPHHARTEKAGVSGVNRFCALRHIAMLSANVESAIESTLRPSENILPVVITFDETCSWQRLDAATVDSKIMVVGGAWPEHAFVQSEQACGVVQEHLAPMMLDLLLKGSDWHDAVSVCLTSGSR